MRVRLLRVLCEPHLTILQGRMLVQQLSAQPLVNIPQLAGHVHLDLRCILMSASASAVLVNCGACQGLC